jgi:GDP-mannose 6-dehydrogenase
MKISVFGLGYVGVVTSCCLADRSHTVTGVDVAGSKVDMINGGHSPIVEPGVEELIRSAVGAGRLSATLSAAEAVQRSDVTFISVGTPSGADGEIELAYVRKVSQEIGEALSRKSAFHVVTCRSTVLPGTTRNTVTPILERSSGKKAGIDFAVAFNPEFLREGASVYDFLHPEKTVIGTESETAAEMLREVYAGLSGEVIVTSPEIAEMTKYAENSFHAMKVTFANEIGIICKSLGLDSHEVLDILCKDKKLNISCAYLRPGFAFGGSCLPKDVRALGHLVRQRSMETPLLEALMRSNTMQIQRAAQTIMDFGKKRVGILGISFKSETDDLRNSPLVELIETLIGKGYTVSLYDNSVRISRLIASNQSYIEQRIPHLAALLCDSVDQVVERSDIIVIGNRAKEFVSIPDRVGPEKVVYDLERLVHGKRSEGNYVGLAW